MSTQTNKNQLSIKEYKEFKELSNQCFKGNIFVVFSEEELNTPEHKRYDELMKRFLFCKRNNIPVVYGEQVIM